MNKRQNIILLLLTSLLLVACGESYNSIYEDVVEVDPNVKPVEGENLNKVRILPTLKDPDYYIYTEPTEPTKGMGPYYKFPEDSEHWLNAVIKCFAFPAESGMYSEDNAMLWEKDMKLLDEQGTLAFYEEGKPKVQYYKEYNKNKPVRYKFFAFSPDTEEKITYKTVGNKLTAIVKLDGTQDILHSFASHTREEYETAIEKLPANDETTLVFLRDSTKNLYNALSGNRGIHPIFRINHVLPRFELCVKGGVDDSESKEKDKNQYVYCVIESVKIKAPGQIEMEIANDAWEERDMYQKQLDDNSLLVERGDDEYFDADMLKNPMHGKRYGIDFDDLEKQYNEIVKDDHHFWVETSDTDTVAKPIMLPPVERMQLQINYNYIILVKDSEGRDVIDKLVPWTSTVTIEPKQAGHERFLSNRKYRVIITIYGFKSISVQVVPLSSWIKDQEIPLGEDK